MDNTKKWIKIRYPIAPDFVDVVAGWCVKNTVFVLASNKFK